MSAWYQPMVLSVRLRMIASSGRASPAAFISAARALILSSTSVKFRT